MIYDHRTYTCRPNTLKKQMKLYEEHRWDAQRRHLGDPVLYGAVETGDVNSYIHIWVYKDATGRAARRKAMSEDPEWIAYLQKSLEAGYLVSQVNTILTPAPFFAPKASG